ncbi:tail protein [Eggerthella phage PMBT5]|uniref:Putative tail protein n=1 Tax=Eggerthella phage PMBT5 TaxID=2283015 RepID=A0A345MKE1_9CAUD|nr:tail protein [Eggerthella phage PMBT5]AXH71804.1 tail-associated lysin [Eggerthella phage PMBT5]
MIVLKLADGSTLHDVRDNNRQVVGYISDAKNAVGTLDFDIYPKHPAYNAIKAGSTKIRAYRDGMWTHDYTVESVTNDLQLKKHVTATDELQYLERIEVPSYKTGVDGVPQTVSGFSMWLIEYYNARSGGERFAFGQIEGDIIDPTTTLDRSSDSPATVASIVKDKIIDSMGGYVRVRRVDGVLTIDLKADAAGVCKQYIEFGENLVDYADEQDAGELCTAVTAESTYKNDAGDEVTITLADAPNGKYLTGYAKQGDTVTNTVAAAAYGVRRKHLTFDGIKDVYTLVENCEKYIAAHCEPVTTVNVSAADLSTLDSNVQSFDVGLYTRVKAAPMGFDAAFECQGAKRSLNDPTDDKYTLGWTWNSLSSINNRKSVETALGIGKLEQATTEIDQAAKDAAQQAQTAQDVASAANINATDAVTKADSAKEEATSASDTAQRAEAISAEAKQTATQANGVAQDASETASTAAITAAQAGATATEAKSTATQTASDLSNYATNTNLMLEDMQGQIDGSITTWFFAVPPTNENAPANEWTTTDLKNKHLGDLYYDTNTGYSYRWQVLQSVYSWQRITDVDVTKALADASKAQDTADAKRRVFYSQPVPPYDKGDLWSQGTNGEMLICATPKTDGMSFLASDWGKATKYTDDTKAIEAERLAEEAAKTATDFIDFGADGLIVGDMTDGALAGNVRIASDGIELRDGTSVLARLKAELLELAANSVNAIIKLCGGLGTIRQSTERFADGDHSSLTIESTESVAVKGANAQITATGSVFAGNVKSTPSDPAQYCGLQVTPNGSAIVSGYAATVGSATKVYLSSDKNLPVQINGSDMVDFVVAQGTSGGWRWRKWASGLAECVGSFSVSISTPTAWGAVFYGNVPRQSYPFTFISTPEEFITLQGGYFWIIADNNSKTQTNIAYCVSAREVASINVWIEYKVEGRWK